MTRDEITRTAQEADCMHVNLYGDQAMAIERLTRFAALVAAAEREECIALHDNEYVQAPVGNSAWGEAYQEGWIDGTSAYRDEIRARGEKGQS